MTNPGNETNAAEAFSRQSLIFDSIYAENTIVEYKRERVRAHVESLLQPGASILELNAGTGQDAIYFAGQGYHIHATDISAGMLQQTENKIVQTGLRDQISTEQCSFTSLDQLQNRGPFDMIFSNFAGLNCTGDIEQVLHSFRPLLKPGGIVTLVLLPDFCLWETLLLLKGNFKTAFRRFNASKGREAHVEGVHFKCWYFKPSRIIKGLGPEYTLLRHEGLCTLVPPSYIDHFAEKHPRLYAFLKKAENSRKERWPWKNIGDYYIISFRKN